MTLVGAARPAVAARLRREARRHPQYGAVLAVAAAWAAVLAYHATAVHEHTARAYAVTPGSVAASVLHNLPMWTVTCVAMMVPTALPAVRHVGLNSLRWRRQRSIAVFLSAYLGLWVLFGLVALVLSALVDGRPTANLALAAGLAAAGGWLALPGQQRFRRACHRTVPLPPTGWRAARGCARFGLRHGAACVGMCWPLMLVMALVAHGSVLWMIALTGAAAAVKLLPHGQRIARSLAVVLGTVAVVVLLARFGAGFPGT